MTMVKLSSDVTELEGREGGTIFRKDVCGQHAQATPRHVNRAPTQNQVKRQNCFKKAKRLWTRSWTSEFASRWRVYAEQHPKKNKKGETVIWTDGQTFMSINIIRCCNDLEMITEPPS